MKTLHCDSCGEKMRGGQKTWHFVCHHCGLERSTLEPNINRTNIMDEDEREIALNPIRQQNFEMLLDHLNTIFPSLAGEQQKKLLDVGCAHGWFIEKAGKYYDVLGLEPDDTVATKAQQRNIRVRIGYFPTALDDHEKFDVIIFNDVLEHIPNTKEMLRECEHRLLPGGIILINAPDKRGFFYKTSKFLSAIGMEKSFERMWQVGLPSPHLYYFNSSAIEKISKDVGLTVFGEIPLPSITTKGLYKRITYAGNVSKIKAMIICAGIFLSIPVITLCRSDISVWMLKRTNS